MKELNVRLPGAQLCKTPEAVQAILKMSDTPAAQNRINRIFQQTANALSPGDTQYRIPQGLVFRIQELLLDETDETKPFREDVAILINPVSFVGKDTTKQVESTIINKAFGITTKPSSASTQNIIEFFQKHKTLLGYKPVESKIEGSGQKYETLPESTRLGLEILEQLEDPSKAAAKITDSERAIANMDYSLKASPESLLEYEGLSRTLEKALNLMKKNSQDSPSEIANLEVTLEQTTKQLKKLDIHLKSETTIGLPKLKERVNDYKNFQNILTVTLAVIKKKPSSEQETDKKQKELEKTLATRKKILESRRSTAKKTPEAIKNQQKLNTFRKRAADMVKNSQQEGSTEVQLPKNLEELLESIPEKERDIVFSS